MVLTEEQMNFGRIVALNSFNREIAEDEAAVLFSNVLVVLFESVTGVAGGVDRCVKINSTDDVFVAKVAFLYSLLNKHASNKQPLQIFI